MFKDKEIIDCSLCGAEDFRKCKCPWHLPLDKWPKKLIEKIGKRDKD